MISTLYPPAVRGGYEVECADVVERLRERHEVLVLTSDHPVAAGLPDQRVDGHLPDQPWVQRTLPFLHHRMRDSLTAPIASLRAAGVARQALESFQPDLIYVWNGAQIPQAALRILDASALPLAFRVCEHWFASIYRHDQFMRHLYPGDRGLRRVWAGLIRAVNRLPALRLDVDAVARAAVCWNSDLVRNLAPAPACFELILERKIYPATHQSERFLGLARNPSAEPTILLSGRLAAEKGPDVAYRALATLRDRHGIEARLVVAGAGDERFVAELDALAAQLGIAERVERRGRLDSEQLRAVLAGAHAMIIPSVWQEPAPLVATEAALARVPVVASRTGGIPEMLAPDEHALYFEIRDFEGAAAALARTLTDQAATAARVERAFVRGQELGFRPYLAATERFIEEAMAAFGARLADGAVSAAG